MELHLTYKYTQHNHTTMHTLSISYDVVWQFKAKPHLKISRCRKIKNMIQKAIELISKQKWAYNLAQRIIANKIIHHSCKLTPEYLINKGWVEDDDGFYSEPNIKDRDKVWVDFDRGAYGIWHGSYKTFIALESSKEWFEQYYLLINKSDKMYSLAGI